MLGEKKKILVWYDTSDQSEESNILHLPLYIHTWIKPEIEEGIIQNFIWKKDKKKKWKSSILASSC